MCMPRPEMDIKENPQILLWCGASLKKLVPVIVCIFWERKSKRMSNGKPHCYKLFPSFRHVLPTSLTAPTCCRTHSFPAVLFSYVESVKYLVLSSNGAELFIVSGDSISRLYSPEIMATLFNVIRGFGATINLTCT